MTPLTILCLHGRVSPSIWAGRKASSVSSTRGRGDRVRGCFAVFICTWMHVCTYVFICIIGWLPWKGSLLVDLYSLSCSQWVSPPPRPHPSLSLCQADKENVSFHAQHQHNGCSAWARRPSERATSEEDPWAADAMHKTRDKTNWPNTKRERQRERKRGNQTYVCAGKSCPI